MYRAMIAKEVTYQGYEGVQKNAYYARPEDNKLIGGVVFIHHLPGWTELCIETVRRLAHHGFAAISPNMYAAYGEGDPDDIGARARADGGVSDEQMLGDVTGAMSYLRELPECNGKVAVMGFCSGGRHAYLAACRIQEFDAAIDCWGGRVVVTNPKDLNDRHPIAPIEYTKDLNCPLLGLFGNDDKEPDPAQVDLTEKRLKSLHKNYEFHRYDGAGHGFFDWTRPHYRPEQAMDGWKRVVSFLQRTIA